MHVSKTLLSMHVSKTLLSMHVSESLLENRLENQQHGLLGKGYVQVMEVA